MELPLEVEAKFPLVLISLDICPNSCGHSPHVDWDAELFREGYLLEQGSVHVMMNEQITFDSIIIFSFSRSSCKEF